MIFSIIIYKMSIFTINFQGRAVTIDGYYSAPRYKEGALKKAVASQPVSVVIRSDSRAFQFYKSVRTFCFFSCLPGFIYRLIMLAGNLQRSVWNGLRPCCDCRWI